MHDGYPFLREERSTAILRIFHWKLFPDGVSVDLLDLRTHEGRVNECFRLLNEQLTLLFDSVVTFKGISFTFKLLYFGADGKGCNSLHSVRGGMCSQCNSRREHFGLSLGSNPAWSPVPITTRLVQHTLALGNVVEQFARLPKKKRTGKRAETILKQLNEVQDDGASGEEVDSCIVYPWFLWNNGTALKVYLSSPCIHHFLLSYL